MTDYEWRAAELMLKLAIATEALQQKHEENLELIQERNKWQAIAENALEAASPPNPLRERPMLTAKEIEEWYEDEVNARIVSGSVKLSSTDENAQPAHNGCRGSLSPDADQLSFAGQKSLVAQVLWPGTFVQAFQAGLWPNPSTGGAKARPCGAADVHARRQ